MSDHNYEVWGVFQVDPNDPDELEAYGDKCDTKKEALGRIKILLDDMSPEQIVFLDKRDEDNIAPEDFKAEKLEAFSK